MFFVLPSSQFKEILKVVYQSEETCVFPFTSSALSYFTFKFPLLLYKHLAIALLHTFKQCILSLLKKKQFVDVLTIDMATKCISISEMPKHKKCWQFL